MYKANEYSLLSLRVILVSYYYTNKLR